MYEARQNKEKVSRRIDRGSVKHNMKFKNNSKFATNINNTIQLATALRYEDIRGISPEARINGIAHSRVDMTYRQKNGALRPNGYQIPPRATCNHCVSYKMIRNAVNEKLTGVELNDGLNNLNLLDEAQHCYFSETNTYDEDSISDMIDNHIANLANNPNNLFYWPYHLGDDNGDAVDYPEFSNKYAGDYGYAVSKLNEYKEYLENVLSTRF